MNGNVGLFLTKFRRNLNFQSLTFEGFKKTRGALDSAFCVPWSLSYSKKTPFSGAQNPKVLKIHNLVKEIEQFENRVPTPKKKNDSQRGYSEPHF